MPRFPRTVATRLFPAGLCALFVSQALFAQTTVRSIKVLGGKDAVEIEVESSGKLVPQTQALTGPDRLVIDFPNATPGGELRSQSVNVGEIKDLRVGLFQSKPPVTRVVLDLRTAQTYEIFPNGRTTIIKVKGSGEAQGQTSASLNDSSAEPVRRPGLVEANYTKRIEPVAVSNHPGAYSSPAQPKFSQPASNRPVANAVSNDAPSRVVNAAPPKPALEVAFQDGLLTIHSNKATLSEVLFAVQQRTGAEVSIAAGAEQEKVVAEIGPAPAQQVLTQLLNGSKFNYLLLNAVNDPQRLDRVILTPRPDRVFSPPAPAMAQMTPPPDNTPQMDPQPAYVPPPPQAQPVNRGAPGAQGEGKPDDTDSDQ
jgi:hypothetical protein